MDFKIKKGQVAIFIILALIIVASIVVFFFYIRTDSEEPVNINPKSVVQKCVKEIVDDSIEKLLDNGGIILPKNTIQYNGEKYTYLCYQGDYYLGCYNLYPMLEERIEDEMEQDTKKEIQECFNFMKEDFENKGFEISGGSTNYSIDLLPGRIRIALDKKVQISKGESSQVYENFGFDHPSSFYELIKIAREVINSESQYCNFEYNGYTLIYPIYKIWRIDYDASKIYRIIDRKSGDEFKFSVRSCAFAPGI